jgi:capsular polysaccharide export protein
MLAARVGGAFWAAPDGGSETVIVVATGDAALDHQAFTAALAAHDAADILVLAEGGSAPLDWLFARCRVVTRADPWSLLERVAEIHTGGESEFGRLGWLAGRVVHWHGAFQRFLCPAEWAFSDLVAGTRYVDPYAGRPASAEQTIDLLTEWRPILAENRRIACCVGMSHWKRRRIASFFHSGESAPAFVRTARRAVEHAARQGGAIAVWNSRQPADLVRQAAAAGVQLIRVEDGFLRSVGLGSDFLPPASVIADSRGIYYDPSTPSDLEHILAEADFGAALLDRARALLARLLAQGVTKYGSGGQAPALADAGNRRRILVPGQVADDLSVQLGGGDVRDNLGLLRHVRLANPDAFILYKPHPDVEAGHRPGAVAVAQLQQYASQVISGGAMAALIDQVDEVHTMTSLAGFEALLRRRTVHVYGQPFYAGWGLTIDRTPITRRARILSLEQLVAGVLILYPRYLDPVTSLPCTPELLIERLADTALWQPGWLMRLRQLQGRVRRAWRSARPALLPRSKG